MREVICKIDEICFIWNGSSSRNVNEQRSVQSSVHRYILSSYIGLGGGPLLTRADWHGIKLHWFLGNVFNDAISSADLFDVE
jgi:hypothetical protein